MRGWLIQRFAAVGLIVFITLFIPNSSSALSLFNADVMVEGIREAQSQSSSAASFDEIPAVRVSGRLKNVGHIDARFTTRRNKTWTAVVQKSGQKIIDPVDPLLLRGRIAVGSGTPRSGRKVFSAAASVIKKELKITFPGKATGSRRSRQRIYTVRLLLDGSIRVSARVSSIPSRAFHRGACGAATSKISAAAVAGDGSEDGGDNTIEPIPADSPTPIENGSEPGAKMAKVITISTDADPEWYAKYGDSSNAVIASIINTAEAIYEKQLGIRFKIIRQHTYTGNSPYTSSDPGTLLRSFVANSDNKENLGNGGSDFNEEVDVKHLFTGKDMTGSVIGVAYVGTVCAAPGLAFGVTQSYVDAANAGIFAHELGHNFGAFHDVSDRSGLMYPSISIPPADRFSDTSVSEISEHLARYGTCISRELVKPREDLPRYETPTPAPPSANPKKEPARISLRRRLVGTKREPVVSFSGRVFSDSRQRVGAVKLTLVVSGVEVGRTVTNDKGEYQFLVKFSMPQGREVYAFVETTDGEVASRLIWIKSSSRFVRHSSR